MMSRRVAIGAAAVLLAVMNAGPVGPAIRIATLNGPPGDLVVAPVSGHAFIVLSQADSLSQTGSVNRFIAMVDTRTGALLRTLDPGGDEQNLELDPRTHRLVVSGNGRAALLDTRRGSVVYATGATLPVSSVALDPLHGHTIVVGNGFPNPGDGLYLTVLDSRTGLPLHKVRLNSDQPIGNSLAVDDAAGRIVVASTSLVVVKTSDPSVSNVNALERVTTLDLSGRVMRTVAVGQLSGPTSNGISIVPDRRRGRALVLDPDTSTVSVLDERTGSLIHATSLAPRRQKHGATIYNSYLESWAVDEQTGRLFVAMPPFSACHFPGGCRQIGSGSLTALDTQTGRVAHATSLPEPGHVVVDLHADRVLLTGNSTAGMTISILDARTGRLLHTIGSSSWGQWGSDPVVDTRTDRAYISGSNGLLSVLDTHDGRIIRTLPLVASTTGWRWTNKPIASSWSGRPAPPRQPTPGAGCPAGCAPESPLSRRPRIHFHPPHQPAAKLAPSTSLADHDDVSADLSRALLSRPRLRSSPQCASIAAGRSAPGDNADSSSKGMGPRRIVMVSRRIVSGVVGVLLVAGAGGAVAVMDAVSAGPSIHVAALNGVPDDMVVDPVSGHAFVMLSRPNAQAPAAPTDTVIAVVDTRTGTILRIVDAGIGVDLGGLDLDARTGRLVVAGNNQMTLLDTRRGNPVNAASLPLAALSVAIDRRRGHVVVASDGGQSRGDDGPHLTILDIRAGLPLRDVPLNAAAIMPNGLAIDDAAGRIVVASTSLSLVSSPAQPTPHVETFKRVTVLDTAGHVLRTVTVGLSPGADNNGNGLLIVLDRRRRHALVLDLDTSTISVLDERTGSPIHATSLAPPGQKHSGMSYAPYLESWAIDEQAGYLFMAMPPPLACVASQGCNPVGPGYLDTFDTQTGLLVRVTPVPDAKGIVVDSHAGRILVSGNSAGTGMSLSILDSRTGRLLRTIGPSPAPWGQWGSAPVVDTGTDRAYVSGGNGTLCVLDIRDGRVIRTLPLGGQYDRLALDAQAHRIILVGEVSPSAPTDHWGWMPGWLRSRIAFIPLPPHPLPPVPPTSGKVATLDIPG